MSKKKSKLFRSLQEYRDFYRNPPPREKVARNKYYQMGVDAVRLALKRLPAKEL